MSAAEQTPVQGAAVVLMTRHGATAEDAERLASVLECAGLLVHPEAAEELLQDCRAQAKAEARAEVDDLQQQLEAARRAVAEQQEEAAAERPSRFHSTPTQIAVWLRLHFAEDVLLRYQQVVGNASVQEAVDALMKEAANPLASPAAHTEGWRAAADMIAPAMWGPYPASLVRPVEGVAA